MSDPIIIAFLVTAYMSAGCLLFCVIGLIAHIFHSPIEWLAGRLQREWWD